MWPLGLSRGSLCLKFLYTVTIRFDNAAMNNKRGTRKMQLRTNKRRYYDIDEYKSFESTVHVISMGSLENEEAHSESIVFDQIAPWQLISLPSTGPGDMFQE